VNTYRAIVSLPNVLDLFFEELALRTGWVFTVLAGGLEPINGGKIRTLGYVIVTIADVSRVSSSVFYRYDYGKTNTGLSFGTAHPSFHASFLKPFAAFVKQVFHESFLDLY
jgi:hypothetical protein